jgi:hypothetical protein
MESDNIGAGETRHVSSEDGTLLCVFVPQVSSLGNGTFISRDEDSIQVGTFKYDSAHLINRHKHNELPRVADRTQEFIFVYQREAVFFCCLAGMSLMYQSHVIFWKRKLAHTWALLIRQ